MKKTSKTIQWIFTALFGMCALANGFHFSTLILLLATILLMPIEAIRDFLKDKAKIKSGLAIAIAIILFFVGILSSPLAETPPDEYDSSSISSSVSDDTDSIGESSSSDTSSLDTSSKEETTSKEESSSSSTTTTSSSQSQETSSVGTGTATAVNPLNVPEYSGKAYITINDNVPNFSASELTSKGYENYSKLDSLGRTQVAVASVGFDTMPGEDEERGSISSIKPSGWIQAKYTNISGGWLYNRCHLIGWQLSAENANKSNLIIGTKPAKNCQ